MLLWQLRNLPARGHLTKTEVSEHGSLRYHYDNMWIMGARAVPTPMTSKVFGKLLYEIHMNGAKIKIPRTLPEVYPRDKTPISLSDVLNKKQLTHCTESMNRDRIKRFIDGVSRYR